MVSLFQGPSQPLSLSLSILVAIDIIYINLHCLSVLQGCITARGGLADCAGGTIEPIVMATVSG